MLTKTFLIASFIVLAAAEKGFDNAAALSSTEFDPVRGDKRFKEVLDAVNKNQSSKSEH